MSPRTNHNSEVPEVTTQICATCDKAKALHHYNEHSDAWYCYAFDKHLTDEKATLYFTTRAK